MGKLATYWNPKFANLRCRHSWAFSENARFTDIEHIVSCASSLAQENEYATDNLILCLLRMQCVAQRLHATFTDIESFETDLVQLNAQLDHVEETLMNIKCSLPPLLRHSGKHAVELGKTILEEMAS